MRKLGFLAAVAIVSISFIAGVASAQLPGDSQCALRLTAAQANPSTSGFETDRTREFTFVAENPSATLDASGTLEIQRSPPPSWHWSTQSRTVEVPAGGTNETTVRVTFLGERSVDASLSVQIVDVACQAGGISSPQEGDSSQVISMAFTHAPLPAEGADEGLPWAWIVFGVIVAGSVVGVPLVYRSRSSRIDATCEESEKDVIAGRGTSFPVTLKNKGSDPVPVRLEVSDVQEGWSALTTLPDLEMGPKETRTIYMMVRAPPEAKPGDLCVAKLQVKPEGGSAQEVKTLARVDAGAGESQEEGDEVEADEDASSA